MPTRPLLLALSLLAGSPGCSITARDVKEGSGLSEVDALLGHVERVQVEAAASRERAQDALEALRAILAPGFKGDPATAHEGLSAAVERSEQQADALRASVRPLRKTGEAVFERWTEDLQSFGNIALRQRSQERLEETRRRYDAILAAAVAAQLAYDTFDGDLRDHALFLEHDFNDTSIALIAQELEGLRARAKELARRLDACGTACQAYVDLAAPAAPAEPAADAPAPAPVDPAAPPPAPETPPPAKKAPQKKKPAAQPAPSPGG